MSSTVTTGAPGSDDYLIPLELVDEVLAKAMASGADFAEVFAEDSQRSSVVLDDGRIEALSSDRDRGVGIRVVAGDSTGFSHTADLTRASLLAAVSKATQAVGSSSASKDSTGNGVLSESLEPRNWSGQVEVRPESVPKGEKVELLRQAQSKARSEGAEIVQVAARCSDTRRRVQIANSQGLVCTDDQTRTLFFISAVASGDQGLQTGAEQVGHTGGYELFQQNNVDVLAQKAAQRALTKLEARPAPSGVMPVVIGPGTGGVLFHEACGHGLEADLVRQGASVFAGRIGEQVASPLVSVIDDGTMLGEWGYFGVDDEGQPSQRNVLIQDGVLVDFMWDAGEARREGRASSGNGRRQSYRHLPMVRMANTYLSPGESNPEDIIASVDDGVYVAKLSGGQVNTATGDFVFGMVEAYIIKNGRLAEPLRDGQLIGNGPKTLQLIEAVGNDFSMGYPGTCGKDGQGVPVGFGVPTLKVAELTVGGTA